MKLLDRVSLILAIVLGLISLGGLYLLGVFQGWWSM